MGIDLLFLGAKLVAAGIFLIAVMFVLGFIYGLIDMCVFFPPAILFILKSSVTCVAISAVYKLFF